MTDTRQRPVLIRGAAVLGAEPVDLLLADGRIEKIGEPGTLAVDLDDQDLTPLEVDAAGLIALPGLVDLHTHLREPGREDAETVASGTRAAALGGFTAVHAMANTDPVADTAGVVEQVWRLGHAAGWCDVQPLKTTTMSRSGKATGS